MKNEKRLASGGFDESGETDVLCITGGRLVDGVDIVSEKVFSGVSEGKILRLIGSDEP